MQQMLSASSKPSGQLTIRKFGQVVPAPLSWKLRNAARPGFIKGWFAKHVVVPAANLFGVGTILAELELRKRVWYDDLERLHFVSLRRDGLYAEAEAYARSRTYWVDYGVASYRVVTNNGVGFIVDAFQNLIEAEIMNYHGVGTGTNAEASSDSALQTESTTALNPDNTRATGTQTEPASNQYRSTGTLTFDASAAVTEHGLFSVSATGSGVLFDRSVFSANNMLSGETLQCQYTVTFSAGG